MAVAAKSAIPVRSDDGSPHDLAHETSPAVLIDPVAAEITAANAGGGSALGLFSYASFPVALDPAMPAVARLRQIVSAGCAGKSDFETLLFWRSSRLKRVKCRIARQGAKGSKLLLLYQISSVESPDDKLMERTRAKPPLAVMPENDVTSLLPTPQSALSADTLAKLAHELKTPLTAIAAAAEIMRDERLGKMQNARYLSYAADIHESATHALDVIMALLAERAKPSASASRLIAIDLNAIAERTVSSVKALAESCGLNLSFDAHGGSPHVVANPTALRQILLNLLTNAIKFTPPGGDVRVATGFVGDGRVFLVVRDTGRGMTGSEIDAGSTAHSGVDGKPAWARGMGIGLPLVESLVRDMGAEIEISSEPRNGTVATILFSDFARRFK